MNIFSIILIIFISALGVISTSDKDNDLVSNKIYPVKRDSVDTNLISFQNYNKVYSFITYNDTLFCKTENGILFYDKPEDRWRIDKSGKNRDLKFTPNIHQSIGTWSEKKIDGYHCGTCAITKQKGEWSLIKHANEGSIWYKQEIIDTLQKIIYRFPYELITDFIVEDSFIWVGSEFGISKIDFKTLSRIDYLMLPAIKQLKKIIETTNSIFYLDFHYGLFKYDKQTKNINPITGINKYVNETNFKYSNSYLIDKTIYTLAFPSSKLGKYLEGYASLLIYNIDTQETKKIDTKTKYFDSFLLVDNFLICYGSWSIEYDLGVYCSGGAIAYNLKNDNLIEISDRPVQSLTRLGNKLKLENVQFSGEEFYVTYEEFQIPIDFSLINKNSVLEIDTFYNCFPDAKDGDTIIYNNKAIVMDKYNYDRYSNLYSSFKTQQLIFSYTLLNGYLVKPKMINVENKKIEKDYY